MSLVIHYENGRLIKVEQSYKRTTPSPVYLAEDGKTFVMGEVFDATYEDVAKSNWKEDPDILNEFEGAFSLVYADDNGCNFCTDRKGIETWFYYRDDTTFIISDSFWDIVKIIKPTYDNLNIKQVKASLICPPVKGETPIWGLNYLLPAHLGKFNAISGEFDVYKYWEFKFSGEVSDIDVAVENMDNIFDNAMKQIKEKVGDLKFGMGLSGGLDSRVVAHYAVKNGLDLQGFNVCVPRPHGIFKAKSIVNAKQIAEKFNISYCDVKYRADGIENKISEKTMRYPLGTGRNSFKYEQHLPDFDVLITGGSGELVGDYLPVGIENLTPDELFLVMKNKFISSICVSSFFSRVVRAINYILGTKIEKNPKSAITSVLSEEDFQYAENGLYKFIASGLKAEKTNVEIYEDYLINILTSRNRYGAFETMLGTKRSFSVYIPFLFNEVLKWTPELLYSRKALNALIVKKIPEVSEVNAETYDISPNAKNSIINKISAILGFLIRGNGTAIDQYWIKKRRVKKALHKRLNNECSWFLDILGIEKKELSRIVFKSKETGFMINIWELKALIDCLETKEYMNFDFTEEK